MMKRMKLFIIALCFFLLSTLFLAKNVFAADATLYFSPSSTTVDTGCYPSLDVMLDTGGQETTGVDIFITYDSSKLEIYSLTAGTLYDNYLTLNTSTAGKITIQAVSNANNTFSTTAGSAQTLATIVFKTIGYGTNSVAFNYTADGGTTDTNVTAVGGADILGSAVTDANVLIEDGASCPSISSSNPSPTPTSSSSSNSNDNSDDEDSGVGGSGDNETYTAPASGIIENTIGLIAFGSIFSLFSLGLALAKK